MASRASRGHRRAGGALLALISLAAAPSLAQDAAPKPPAETAETASTLEILLDRLDSPDLATREAATLDLAAQGRALSEELTPERIAAMSPEQRARLTTILRQRFFATQRAGLGVSFRPLIEDGAAAGVRIDMVVDGFPAQKFLQPGDVIVAIEGRSLIEGDALRADTPLRHAILSRDPGEILDMVVRRGDESLELSVPTGSFEDLRNAQTPPARLMQGAWEWRMERLGLVEKGVISLSEEQLREWRSDAQARRDLPDVAPGGRGGAMLAAERSVPKLAKIEDSREGLERRRLAVAGQLRQVEERLVQTQEAVAEKRVELQRSLGGSKQASRLREEIRRLQQQAASDQQQRKRLMSLLLEMRAAD